MKNPSGTASRNRTAPFANRDDSRNRRDAMRNPSVSGSLASAAERKTPRTGGYFSAGRRCGRRVSATGDSMAERVGFELAVLFIEDRAILWRIADVSGRTRWLSELGAPPQAASLGSHVLSDTLGEPQTLDLIEVCWFMIM